MYKSGVSILLSTIFVLFLSAPTILTAFDVSADTSFFYGVTEEENESKNAVKHIVSSVTNHKLPFEIELSGKKASNFYLECHRSSLSLQTFSPPPEQQV